MKIKIFLFVALQLFTLSLTANASLITVDYSAGDTWIGYFTYDSSKNGSILSFNDLQSYEFTGLESNSYDSPYRIKYDLAFVNTADASYFKYDTVTKSFIKDAYNTIMSVKVNNPVINKEFEGWWGYPGSTPIYYEWFSYGFSIYDVEGIATIMWDNYYSHEDQSDMQQGYFFGSGPGIKISSPVPEPSTLLLFGAGLGGLAFWRRKKGIIPRKKV